MHDAHPPLTHAPGDRGIFGAGSLCGTPLEIGRTLRMSQISADVDCSVCRDLLGGSPK